MLVRPRRVDEPVGGVGTQHPWLRESAHTSARAGVAALSVSTSSVTICGTSSSAGPASAGTAADVDSIHGTWRSARRAYTRVVVNEGALSAGRVQARGNTHSITSGCESTAPDKRFTPAGRVLHTASRRGPTRTVTRILRLKGGAQVASRSATLAISVTTLREEGRRPKA